MRREIQTSSQSVRALAARFGVNPKTIVKWRKRGFTADAPRRHRERSHVLGSVRDLIIVKLRRLMMLPLDDCHFVLKDTIPGLTRSQLHRCLKHYGLSRLSDLYPAISPSQRLDDIGHFVMDPVEDLATDGLYYYFAATDPTSRLVYTECRRTRGARDVTGFLRNLAAFSPYRINAISTLGKFHQKDPWCDAVKRFCTARGIPHKRVLLRAGWSIATRDITGYLSFAQQASDAARFTARHNLQTRLKCLRGRTPLDFVTHAWEAHPDLFTRTPHAFRRELKALALKDDARS